MSGPVESMEAIVGHLLEVNRSLAQDLKAHAADIDKLMRKLRSAGARP
jgi:hypothetical protein